MMDVQDHEWIELANDRTRVQQIVAYIRELMPVVLWTKEKAGILKGIDITTARGKKPLSQKQIFALVQMQDEA